MIRLTNELQNVKTVAIAGHIRPDGDCTGSCLAAAGYIRENFPGISVDVYLDSMNPNFLFLKGAKEVKTDWTEDKTYDLFIALDASDRERLAELFNISEDQMKFITNAEAGHGLMKIGKALIPFVNRFPKNTELYRYMTTKPGETEFWG